MTASDAREYLASQFFMWFYIAGIEKVSVDDTVVVPRRGSIGCVFTRMCMTLATSFK